MKKRYEEMYEEMKVRRAMRFVATGKLRRMKRTIAGKGYTDTLGALAVVTVG